MTTRCGLVVFVLGVTLPCLPVAAGSGGDRPVAGARTDVLNSRTEGLLGPGQSPLYRWVRDPAAKALDDEAAIDACVAAAMERVGTPGASVAVLRDGDLVYQQGYGVKRRGGNDPVTPQTVFRIGSVTKMMTAAALMQQVEAGRVDLSDPVTRLIPDFSIAWPWRADQITIRHLLTHTSGFPDMFFFVDAETGDDALADWVENKGLVPLHVAPGTFWNYSNPNYMIAGLVVERASGTPYRTYVEQQVWAPAGMTSTTFDPAEVMAAGDWSWGHYTDPNTGYEFIYQPDDYDNASAAPAGYAFSTAGDLVHWAALLMDGGRGVLSPDSVAAMQAHQVSLGYRADQYYGFGVFSETFEGVELKQHGGNIPGWGTSLVWIPDRRFAVAVMANTFESLPDAAYCIADAVLDLDGPDPPDGTTDPATWAAFAGDYDLRDSVSRDWTAEVTWTGDGLDLDLVALWSPGDMSYHVGMVQAYERTFVVDLDGDGTYETDFTFLGNGGVPDPVIWMRNRSLVGVIDLSPREAGSDRP